MNGPIIQLTNVSKTFLLPHERRQTLKEHAFHFFRPQTTETFHSLREITFSVHRGECLGIIGRNGSGKSTLLRLIGGIYPPTAGIVSVTGAVAPFIDIGVGFQPDLSGKDNIYLYGAIMGLRRAEIKKMYNAIVQFAELDNFMDQKLRYYSSGMQVRLAFSVLAHIDADILLIDEALAVGDETFQQKCLDKIDEFKKLKKTILFVSHDANQIKRVCDAVLWLEKGTIKAHGENKDIFNHYHASLS